MFPIKSNCFKVVLSLILFAFLFLTLGAQFLHNHTDSEFHQDCPSCVWLAISVFTFSILLLFLGLLLNCGQVFIPIRVFPISSYQAFRYLRSPPLFI